MNNESLIKISEMASLHGVSRQTLILYDRNGLLEPASVGENGYRYYSVDQVPRLRQICLLKEMGVPLAQIKRYLDAPTPGGMCELMASRRAAIERERNRLERQLRAVEQIDVHFSGVSDKEERAGLPQVSWIGERKAVFSPFHAGRMDSKRLHMALMDAWGRLLDAGIIPSCGFGALLDARAATSDEPLAGAGSMIVLPDDTGVDGAEVRTLPAGEYACVYKYSMPYDVGPLHRLLAWMGDQGLKAEGLVVDCCMLDSVFHDELRRADFCRLEVLLG